MHYWWFFLPVAGAIIGWLVNALLIRFLFRPYNPVKIAGVTLQGLIPKARAGWTKNAAIAGKQFFPIEKIAQKMTDTSNIEKLLPVIDEHIEHFLRVRLKETMPMISMFIGDKTIAQLKGVFIEELKTLFPALINNYIGQLGNDMDAEKIISEKLNSFSNESLENLIKEQSAKYFFFVKVSGALVGLVLGLMQLLISYLAS